MQQTASTRILCAKRFFTPVLQSLLLSLLLLVLPLLLSLLLLPLLLLLLFVSSFTSEGWDYLVGGYAPRPPSPVPLLPRQIP